MESYGASLFVMRRVPEQYCEEGAEFRASPPALLLQNERIEELPQLRMKLEISIEARGVVRYVIVCHDACP